MEKNKFTIEFEINASGKMLYPYLNTASGLAEWIADDVTQNEDKTFNFVWNKINYPVRKVTQKINQYVKFEFINQSEGKDTSWLEFRLESNELTQTSFLKITDYSDITDPSDQKDLWTNLVAELRKAVGA
ncbi:MAG: START-like domain-containing protein [Cytophagaceae bacterium]